MNIMAWFKIGLQPEGVRPRILHFSLFSMKFFHSMKKEKLATKKFHRNYWMKRKIQRLTQRDSKKCCYRKQRSIEPCPNMIPRRAWTEKALTQVSTRPPQYAKTSGKVIRYKIKPEKRGKIP